MADPQVVLTPPADPTPQLAVGTEADRLSAEQRADLLQMLNNTAGQAVLWRIIEDCGLLRAVQSGETEYQRGIAEGRRRTALWLVGIITAIDPAGMVTLQIEAGIRAERRAKLEAEIATNEARARQLELSRMSSWERAKGYISGKFQKPS